MTTPFLNTQLLILLSIFTFAHLTFAEDIPIEGQLITEGNVLVDAKANIYSAGKTVPVAPAGGGAGILPPVISFSTEKEKFILFPNITGQISCCDPPLYNSADGAENGLGFTAIQPLEELSGIIHNKTMFLVGVFTSETEARGSAPELFDYTPIENKDTITIPGLNRVFLIGDGNNGKRYFYIPAQATQLFLGFVDGDETGQVGFYDDNLGQLSVNFAIYESPSAPLPVDSEIDDSSTAPKLSQGLIAHYTFEESNYTDRYGSNVTNHLADSSGFNFHATLRDDAPVTFEPGKYQQAIVFQEPAKFTITDFSSVYARGIPMNGNWTISTWFVYLKTDIVSYNFIISTSLITLSERCRSAHITVVDDELGTAACVTLATSNFEGSGFLMSSLSEGWHHLIAVGNEGNTTFYIDGQKIGQSASHIKSNMPFLGGEQFTLDDLRIYNRALSLTEIHILSETIQEESSTTPDDCTAKYDEAGKLSIPCVTVPAPFGEAPLLYEAEMELIPETVPLQFILKDARLTQ
jgi:hypothetical protein